MGRSAEPLFHEEQAFRQARVRIALAIVPTVFLALLIWQVVLGHPWGRHPMSNGGLIGWSIFLWLVYLRLITVKLVTDLSPDRLSISMRGLWRVRRVPVNNIETVEVVTFDARDYGGYGIRSTRAGKAYIASGNRGVRIKLRKGGRLLVGSQRPDALAKSLAGLTAGRVTA